jgi:hypothetical protein
LLYKLFYIEPAMICLERICNTPAARGTRAFSEVSGYLPTPFLRGDANDDFSQLMCQRPSWFKFR